jgi:hypothetical protein
MRMGAGAMRLRVDGQGDPAPADPADLPRLATRGLDRAADPQRFDRDFAGWGQDAGATDVAGDVAVREQRADGIGPGIEDDPFDPADAHGLAILDLWGTVLVLTPNIALGQAVIEPAALGRLGSLVEALRVDQVEGVITLPTLDAT